MRIPRGIRVGRHGPMVNSIRRRRARREEGDAEPLSISGTPVLTATEGEAYAGFTATASGGTEPYTYSLVGTWPAGISINSSTGAVSGTSTESGSFTSLSVRVTDADSDTDDLTTFALTVDAPAATNPDFAKVVLLAGFDGVDGATSYTDESSYARSMASFNGNAQIDTAQSVFGGSSLLLDGTGDYLLVNNAAEFEIGSSPFCMEARVRISNLGKASVIMSKWGSITRGFSWDYFDGNMRFSYSTDGTSGTGVTLTSAWTPTVNTWYAVCVERDAGGTLRMYVDGVMIGSHSANVTFYNAAVSLYIGRISTATGNDFAGHIDELRWTVGEAPYASDDGYPVHTEAFPRA